MNNNKNKFGLIGYPLGHSFSLKFFTEKFATENINAEYLNFEIPKIADLSNIIEANPDLIGLNVTIPYKEDVLPFLNNIDKDAAKIGAVNVIKIIRDSHGIKLNGYNSDMVGFMNSITPILKPHHKKALILGTGGASKAVEFGLHKLGIETQLVSRKSSSYAISYQDVTPNILEEYSVIVNTTPLGMYPNVDNAPNIPYKLINSNHLCYDLIYNPDKTLFLKNAEEQGAIIKNGLEMLTIQALEAWKIWNN